MTEEGQPSSTNDVGWRSPEASTGHEPHFHVPSYDLPTGGDRDRATPIGSPSLSTPPAVAEPTTGTDANVDGERDGRVPSAPSVNPDQPSSTGAPPDLAAPGPAYPSGVGPQPAYPPPGPVPGSPNIGPTVGGPGAGSLSGPVGGSPNAATGQAGGGWVPPPPREAWRAPRRIETVPGTPFGVVHLDVPPVNSGLAIGALVAGIASVLVALLVACFGLAGASGGWGGWAAGAFAILGGLAGGAAIVLGILGMRQIRRILPPPAIRFTGRGLAIAGLSCGATGLGVTVLSLLLALLLQAA